jgi:hypothetical protein
MGVDEGRGVAEGIREMFIIYCFCGFPIAKNFKNCRFVVKIFRVFDMEFSLVGNIEAAAFIALIHCNLLVSFLQIIL